MLDKEVHDLMKAIAVKIVNNKQSVIAFTQNYGYPVPKSNQELVRNLIDLFKKNELAREAFAQKYFIGNYNNAAAAIIAALSGSVTSVFGWLGSKEQTNLTKEQQELYEQQMENTILSNMMNEESKKKTFYYLIGGGIILTAIVITGIIIYKNA